MGIGEAFGAQIVHAPVPVTAALGRVENRPQLPVADLPARIVVGATIPDGRSRDLPDCFAVTATRRRLIMASSTRPCPFSACSSTPYPSSPTKARTCCAPSSRTRDVSRSRAMLKTTLLFSGKRLSKPALAGLQEYKKSIYQSCQIYWLTGVSLGC
jgi:hypothetical protein